MTYTFYRELTKSDINENFMWYCNTCKKAIPSVRSVMTMVTNIKMVQDQMNEKLSIVEEKLSVVQNQTDMSIEHKIDQALYDFIEREKRKNNVIIYNLPESQVENEEEHGQEEENSVKKICEITEVPFEVVESTTRLGVKKGKDRPLKVIFTNEQDKRKVVKNSARLKQ